MTDADDDADALAEGLTEAPVDPVADVLGDPQAVNEMSITAIEAMIHAALDDLVDLERLIISDDVFLLLRRACRSIRTGEHAIAGLLTSSVTRR